jgi:hypothetical protein
MSSRNRSALPELELLNELFYYHDGHLYNKRKRNKFNIGHFAGGKRKDGRYRVSVKNKRYLRSRIIFKMLTGKEPDYVDHINGNCSDDRIENLQEITSSLNVLKGKKRKNNKSGYNGVRKHSCTGKWESYIIVNYKHKTLGIFEDKEKAVITRQEYESSLLKNIRT